MGIELAPARWEGRVSRKRSFSPSQVLPYLKGFRVSMNLFARTDIRIGVEKNPADRGDEMTSRRELRIRLSDGERAACEERETALDDVRGLEVHARYSFTVCSVLQTSRRDRPS